MQWYVYMMASASLTAWKEFDEALIESVRKSLTQNLCLLFCCCCRWRQFFNMRNATSIHCIFFILTMHKTKENVNWLFHRCSLHTGLRCVRWLRSLRYVRRVRCVPWVRFVRCLRCVRCLPCFRCTMLRALRALRWVETDLRVSAAIRPVMCQSKAFTY